MDIYLGSMDRIPSIRPLIAASAASGFPLWLLNYLPLGEYHQLWEAFPAKEITRLALVSRRCWVSGPQYLVS